MSTVSSASPVVIDLTDEDESSVFDRDAALARELQQQEEEEYRQRLSQTASDALVAQLSARNEKHETERQQTIQHTVQTTLGAWQNDGTQPASHDNDFKLGPLLSPIATARRMQRNVFMLRSHGQRGQSCGYWACFNARAVEDILIARLPLTPHAVARKAGQYIMYIKKADALWTEEVLQVAEKLRIAPCLMGLFPRHGVLPLHSRIPANGATQSDMMDSTRAVEIMARHATNYMGELRGRFERTPATRVAVQHFICNIGSRRAGHWILLTLVREPTYAPVLLMLDSLNRGLNADIVKHVTYVLRSFGMQ